MNRTIERRLSALEAGAASSRECNPVLSVPFDGTRPWPEVAAEAFAAANARGQYPQIVVPEVLDAETWERVAGEQQEALTLALA